MEATKLVCAAFMSTRRVMRRDELLLELETLGCRLQRSTGTAIVCDLDDTAQKYVASTVVSALKHAITTVTVDRPLTVQIPKFFQDYKFLNFVKSLEYVLTYRRSVFAIDWDSDFNLTIIIRN